MTDYDDKDDDDKNDDNYSNDDDDEDDETAPPLYARKIFDFQENFGFLYELVLFKNFLFYFHRGCNQYP